MKVNLKRLAGILCSFGLFFYPSGIILPLSASASTVYGDVDNSGTVDISDVVRLSKFLVGEKLVSDVNMKYADVDQNTVLDTNDAKVIMKYITHFISSLPYSQSGITFNYNTYSVPTDEARSYVKYDCATGNTTNYTLSVPSALNSLSDPLREYNIDDRVLDSSANAQCIVRLNYKKNGVERRGSGFIIDNHIIATCGHCIYDIDHNEFCTDYTIKVYNVAGDTIIATYSADELHLPSAYINPPSGESADYDYGLIYVDENLSQYGKMALGLVTDNFEYTAQTVYVSGYPGKVNGASNTNRVFGSGSILTESTEHQLWYSTYANSGDSGGPVFMEYTLGTETFRSAVGIQTGGLGYGIYDEYYHFGTRITLPLLRFFFTNPNIG